MFLIHYIRQGNQGFMSKQERADIATLLDLNEYAVKQVVLRRLLFLSFIASVLKYFVDKENGIGPAASVLIGSICAIALVFLYLGAFVPIVLLATCASLIAISWMDYNTFVLATCFSALYAVYFFARLRAK